MRTVTTLEPCAYCHRDVTCEWCNGGGHVWVDRCYAGELDDGDFLYWQIR